MIRTIKPEGKSKFSKFSALKATLLFGLFYLILIGYEYNKCSSDGFRIVVLACSVLFLLTSIYFFGIKITYQIEIDELDKSIRILYYQWFKLKEQTFKFENDFKLEYKECSPGKTRNDVWELLFKNKERRIFFLRTDNLGFTTDQIRSVYYDYIRITKND
jgi:hypothetical protein